MTSTVSRRKSIASLVSFDLDQHESTKRVKIARIDEFNIGTFQSKLKFEDLPNELLFYICQFIPLIDLQRAFYNLNLRINKILYSKKFKLDLSMLSMFKYAFDYYCSNQQPFISQIYSLKLCDEYDRVTWFNQHIDMSLFNNLRILTISQPSIENLDKILSKLHVLTNLSYLNIYDALIQSPYITTALFSIRSLKRLILYSFNPILFHFNDNTIQPWTELEYLKLNSCYMRNFLELVKYVGKNVQRMAVSIVYEHRKDPTPIDKKIIDNLLYGDRFQLSIFLNRLEISFDYLSLTDFHLVLKLFPNLKHLTFLTWTSDLNFASSTIWHDFISKNLLKLEELQFYIRVTGHVVQQCPSPLLIQSFENNDYKWINDPVIMNYNHAPKIAFLEIYTYSQAACDERYSVQFYGTEKFMTRKYNMIDINENVRILKVTLNDNNVEMGLKNRDRTNYPKVKTIVVHSQLTTIPIENDSMNSDPPLLEDIIRILNTFSTNLMFLKMNVQMDFPVDKFYDILASIFDTKYIKLCYFILTLQTQQDSPQSFNTEFKLWLKQRLTALITNDRKESTTIEYNIRDQEFAVSF